ncbi:MAG TPA: APC family permease [Kineosporiaceae bacterium]|nr:APC family permease [Kineosporiaceae bacterium]
MTTTGHHDHTIADKGLKSGALGLMSSVVVGLASTAPAYSLAATLGFVAIAVGTQAPAIMVLAFLPMLFIALSYQELNRVMPDCGTTFTWVTRAFGPRLGWLGGWGIVAADIIVMANLAQIAGSYGFLLFGADGLAESKFWVTLVGVLWIVVMTWICYKGIELSARIQYALFGVELVVLVIFAAVALIKTYAGDPPAGSIHPELAWFNPFAIHSFSGFTEGVLLAIFIYWGWDTAVAINEETADKDRTPGRAAVISTIVLLATYAVVTVAAQAYAGVGDSGLGLSNPETTDDVLSGLGNAVLGSDVGKILILMTLTSAAASTQTTILPTARTTLSMASYRAIPQVFARMHTRNLTPTWSTVVMGIASVAFYVGLTLISENVLGDSITSVGLMIAFYYGLTGFACTWYFRRTLFESGRNFLLRGLLPLLGGLMLLAAFLKSAVDMFASDYGATSFGGVGGVFLMGIGALLLGVVLMEAYRIVAPDFWRGRINRAPEKAPVQPPERHDTE